MELIVDNKKISIKHYLNLKLKPSYPDGAVEMYPLYTQVIYDSKSTKFRTFNSLKFLGGSYFFAKSEEGNVSDGSFLKEMPQLIDTDKVILQIVEFEIKKFKGDFKLKGLGKRFPIYASPVLSVVNDSIGFGMNYFMGSKFTYNEFIEIFGQQKPYGRVVLDALNRKPELIRSMPKKLQYYSVYSMLMQQYEDSTEQQINCYDLLIDQKKKRAFYDQVREFSKDLKPENSFSKMPEDDFDEFFSIFYILIYDALKATMT